MKKQITTIGDIVEKSNNVLLQIEATRSLKKQSSEIINANGFTYNKDNLYALATIVECFQTIGAAKTSELKKDENEQPVTNNFEIFLQNTSQKTELLGLNVRKLIAINDTVSQMKTNLEEIKNE